MVTNDKKEGGLGVKNLRLHNKSLLFKWLWRYNKGGDEIWKRLLDAIYDKMDDWRQSPTQLRVAGGVWKGISGVVGRILATY